MIEPWEDPWAPATPPTPAGPRRNGATGDDSSARESSAGTRARRWSRTAPNRDDPHADRLEGRARTAPRLPAAPDDRSASDDTSRHTTSAPSIPIEKLARWALPLALDTSDHLDLSGHRSTVQDLLEAEPSSIRFLLWPRRGPLDASDGPHRHTLELALERDAGDLFVARYWAGDRRLDASIQGRAAAADVDRGWFDRQLVHFVERVLSLT